MKKSEKEKLRKKTLSELKKTLEEKRQKEVLKKAEVKLGKEKGSLLGQIRQEIAVLKTFIQEEEFRKKTK